MKTLNIRIWFVQSFLLMGVLGGLIFFSGLQVYILFSPEPIISLQSSIYLSLFLFLLLIILSLYFGFRGGYLFKGRLDSLLTFVTTLRSGKFSARITKSENDEIGLITDELNHLAQFIQDQVKSLQRLADEKSELANQAHHAAVIEERQRLARELHDSVSQQLFALGMLSSAAIRIIEEDSNQAKGMLEQVAQIASKAQGEMRALLLHLRPIDLKGDSLREGLIKLVRELKEKSNLEIEMRIEEIEHLSKGTEAHVFRIVQEALSNILRHAHAEKVKIVLERSKDMLHLYISDDGKGFGVHASKMTSFGLQSMRERCEELGGVFQIRSKENEGTYINIRIPVEEVLKIG
ncbi:sensor histidine kinase [Falsibacillus pallidus]|uniref:histidine kinase n=1 Tax=Falsibacillus pallidus TaxID=493781 RepID=A0A370GX91_9BACI|nr:sensor histidine kinase [Falsibacillus pallidus]RDI47860.1 NarL family two-component system sensor histidine kinase LiaS [Falsibacillus pallidus]